MNLEEFRARVAAEKRVFATQIEFRDAAEDSPPVVQGHAAVFDRLSEDLGGFKERIKRGAFRKALDEQHDVRLLFNHDENTVLARTQSKTLELREDPKGLRVYSELDPADTDTQRLMPKMRRRDVDQMSFGFTVAKGGDSWSKRDGVQIRTITEIDQLFDVSIVTFPAYPQTDVLVRKASFDLSDEDHERILAELGAATSDEARSVISNMTITGTSVGVLIGEPGREAITIGLRSDAAATKDSTPPTGELAETGVAPAEGGTADEGMDDRLVVASLRRRWLNARISAL